MPTFVVPKHVSSLNKRLNKLYCPLYGGDSGNAHTVTDMTEEHLSKGRFIPNISDMSNKVNYPKWVSKLKRQLARAREEQADLKGLCEYWRNKANEQANEINYWQNMYEIYKASSSGYYELISKKDEATTRVLDIAVSLSEKNRELRLKATKGKDARTLAKQLEEVRAGFEIEKYAKNVAYYFILSHDLFFEFATFCKAYKSEDPGKDCVKCFLDSLPKAPNHRENDKKTAMQEAKRLQLKKDIMEKIESLKTSLECALAEIQDLDENSTEDEKKSRLQECSNLISEAQEAINAMIG